MGLTFIASATADEPGTGTGETTLSFTSGIDSTYNEYQFFYVGMHPQTDEVNFTFQVNAVGGADFDEHITSTFFRAYHGEGGGTELLYTYEGRHDQANTQLYQPLAYGTGNDTDQACSGTLTLYDPSSTTYVKHFTASTNDNHAANYSINPRVAGYINTTNAINQISFKFSGGNIDDGTIYMYGVG